MNLENEINKIDKFNNQIGLEDEYKILEYLNNPQDKLNIIHIAGTNGKGSTLAMIESCLLEAEYSVCKYTSPYLIELKEMFGYNGNTFKNDELIEAYQTVKNAQEQLEIRLTRYQVTVIMMFLLACKVNCDWLLLETGMGGEFDSTNVVNAKYTLITNVSLDHMNILGNTIEEIAQEKVGIIKEYGYIGENNQLLNNVLRNKGKRFEITNTIPHKYSLEKESFTTKVNVDNSEFIIPLYGKQQVNNFLLAYRVLRGLNINEEIIAKGLLSIKWPGRMERLSENPLIIYDGSHNVGATQNLVESLSNKSFEIYFHAYEDKEYLKIYGLLKNLSTKIYYVELDEERSLSYSKFKEKIKDDNVECITSKQFIKSIQTTDKDSLICGTFALYKYLK